MVTDGKKLPFVQNGKLNLSALRALDPTWADSIERGLDPRWHQT
jgi:hypothetical protein